MKFEKRKKELTKKSGVSQTPEIDENRGKKKVMAKVRLNELIVSISGSIDKRSGLYFMTRNGQTYLCKRKKNQKQQQDVSSNV